MAEINKANFVSKSLTQITTTNPATGEQIQTYEALGAIEVKNAR